MGWYSRSSRKTIEMVFLPGDETLHPDLKVGENESVKIGASKSERHESVRMRARRPPIEGGIRLATISYDHPSCSE